MLGLGLLASAGILLAHSTLLRRSEGAPSAADGVRDVDRALDHVFVAEGVDRSSLSGLPPGDAPARLRLRVPETTTLTRMNAEISRAVREAGGDVLDAEEKGRRPESPRALELKVGAGGEVTHELTLRLEPGSSPPPAGPILAVVLDDLGYTLDGLAGELLAMPAPLTFAVLPGLPASRSFTEEALARGHEVILHLPMEPIDFVRHDPGEDALLVDLEPPEILRRLRLHLDSLGGYRGVSNHMGSRFTSRPDLVKLVLREIRRRDAELFFLDSRTTPYSVVPQQARHVGLPCVVNNLFLDGSDENGRVVHPPPPRVAEIARRRGHAVVIGHVRPRTVEIVRDAIDEWTGEGIRLVALSDLVHRVRGASPP